MKISPSITPLFFACFFLAGNPLLHADETGPFSIPTHAGAGADSYISSLHEADDTHNTENRLRVRLKEGDRDRKTYLRFDLSTTEAIAADAVAVELQLTMKQPSGGVFRLYGLEDGVAGDGSSDWDAATLSWNNAPQNDADSGSGMLAGASLLGTFSLSGTETEGSLVTITEADVPGLGDWVREDDNGLLTLVMTSQTHANGSLEFASSRNTDFTNPAPKLVLHYSEPEPDPLPANLQGLREHPRLLFTEADEARIKNLLGTDAALGALVDVLRQYADQALTQPVGYNGDPANTNVGPDMQFEPNSNRQRRWAMFRVFNCALLYRLTDEVIYAERAREELLAFAGLPYWTKPNTTEHLYTAEIAAFMAIGYDWLYDFLTESERTTIRNALIQNALLEAEPAYESADNGYTGLKWTSSRWPTRLNNWNQVCNAGFLLAALAVAEETPDLASKIVDRATHYITYGMEILQPDGASEEGPSYWAYGTTYNAVFFAALESALGHLAGLDELPTFAAFESAGTYHIQTLGPTLRYFDYGDSKDIAYFSPVLFWFARHFEQPTYAWFERWLIERDMPRMESGELMLDDTLDRFLALLVVWYDDSGENVSYGDLPLDTHFRGMGSVAAMRSDWQDPDAIYIGFKGGQPSAAHGHLDYGGFVLDALGERWAWQFGNDQYDNSPRWNKGHYFDFADRRWNFYRNNNFSKSTLVINGQRQNFNQSAPLIGIETLASFPDHAAATIDLSVAYDEQATAVRRGYAMLDRARVLIEDRLTGVPAGQWVRWGMATRAEVAIQAGGTEAVLTRGGKQLTLTLLDAGDAVFEVISTNPYDTDPYGNPINPVLKNYNGQNTNEGSRMLAVYRTSDGGALGFRVLATPHDGVAETLRSPDFSSLALFETEVPVGTPWSVQQLGGASGNAFEDGDRIRLEAGGSGLGGTSDAGVFLWQDLAGDGEVIAQITGRESPEGSATSGLMIRGDPAADAPLVHLALDGDGLHLSHRATAGGLTASTSLENTTPFPYWLRLRREGDTFTAYRTRDGVVWRQLGSVDLPDFPENTRAGLAGGGGADSTEWTTCYGRFCQGSFVVFNS